MTQFDTAGPKRAKWQNKGWMTQFDTTVTKQGLNDKIKVEWHNLTPLTPSKRLNDTMKGWMTQFDTVDTKQEAKWHHPQLGSALTRLSNGSWWDGWTRRLLSSLFNLKQTLALEFSILTRSLSLSLNQTHEFYISQKFGFLALFRHWNWLDTNI